MIVVVSHPRSGTHLTIDTIRRNFPSFALDLLPHESAGELTLCLDGGGWAGDLSRRLKLRHSKNLILHTHRMGDAEFKASLKRRLDGLDVSYIYPFRRPVATLRSFAAFSRQYSGLAEFTDSPDQFFGSDLTVEGALRRHAASWRQDGVHFLDVDALIKNPAAGIQALAARLRETPRFRRRPLPRQKLSPSRWGELWERLTGRESTAVVVRRAGPTSSPQVLRRLELRLADLHAQLLLCAQRDSAASVAGAYDDAA